VRVLFDQGTPKPLRRSLQRHTIETAYERGWSTLENGELIAQAEEAGFDVLLTTDRQLRYQQNLSKRRLAIVVLSTTQLPRVRSAIPLIQAALDQTTAGSYLEVEIP
jgi:hypothetical protein